MKLQGKTVLITGGTKGIGKACALAFAEQGANVIVTYAHDEKAAKETEYELKKHTDSALLIKASITNEASVDAMFAEIKKHYDSLDILINNALEFLPGGDQDRLDITKKYFNESFMGSLMVTNGAREIMKKGKIIFISSIHGKLGHGNPGVISYSALKAATDSYMKNLAKALAPEILVNSIAPGRTLTPQWGKMEGEEKKELAAGQLINRWIEPEEIADGVVFLAKNDAVCGEVLVIDGGMSLKILG